jgi:hypothetical protein
MTTIMKDFLSFILCYASQESLTSPTSCGRSVGIVHLRTKAMELSQDYI